MTTVKRNTILQYDLSLRLKIIWTNYAVVEKWGGKKISQVIKTDNILKE